MAPSSEKATSLSDTSSTFEKNYNCNPNFDQNGLISAVVTNVSTGEVLMQAWMNEDALHLSITTGIAHFWSRSRKRLWKKGEESGNFFVIEEILIDCDQDCLWIKVKVQGKGVACHTGARSCFYRQIPLTKNLKKGSFPQLLIPEHSQE
ncbi:MAG: phosphoribosyl-AMP cyclohydrolase [Hyphomicrobium sp.]